MNQNFEIREGHERKITFQSKAFELERQFRKKTLVEEK